MVAFTQLSCVSYIYLRAQQKLLSSHTKIGAAGGVGEGGGSNNSINIILFYDFPQYLLGNNSLRVMRDMILFLISSIDDPTISLPNMINSSLFQDIGKKDLEPFFHSFVIWSHTVKWGRLNGELRWVESYALWRHIWRVNISW